MSEYVTASEAESWVCGHCHIGLRIKPVQVEYLGSAFPVDLPICPQCGQVFIPESSGSGENG